MQVMLSTAIVTLNGVSAKFVKGDLLDKKHILLVIGQNPVLLNDELVLDAYKWLVPVQKTAQKIEADISKVRIATQ